MGSALAAYSRYNDALTARDMGALVRTLHPAVVWHQPGSSSLSGPYLGARAVIALLETFVERSGGTFRITTTSVAVNGPFVATTVDFSASRPGHAHLAQTGVDIFRVQDDLVAEVWLFSRDQEAEDAFWA